jgi:hypothetical protein
MFFFFKGLPQLRLRQEIGPQALPLHLGLGHLHERRRVLLVLRRVVQGGGRPGPVVGFFVELENCVCIFGVRIYMCVDVC